MGIDKNDITTIIGTIQQMFKIKIKYEHLQILLSPQA